MPTWAKTDRFRRDYAALSPEQKAAFCEAVQHLVEDLRSGKLRRGLRVKGIQGATGIFEMTWADDGRATFQYGPPEIPGEQHVIWRRVGSHTIFGSP